MKPVPARYVVLVLALASALTSLWGPRGTAGAFFSSPPSPLFKPMAYLPEVARDYRATGGRHLYLPVITRR